MKRPVLKCFMNTKTVSAWCPFCQEWHTHGRDWDLELGRRSHRCAHCTNPESPFLATGYYLKIVNKTEMARYVANHLKP